ANEQNEKWETEYHATLTYHKVPAHKAPVPTDKEHIDVAYLRLTRHTRPRITPPNTPQHEWEETLIFHEYYIFKDIKERTDPKAKWKFDLYLGMMFKLVAAGLEYAELLRRLKAQHTRESTQVNESNIVVTDQMPEPLTKEDMEYKDWLKKHHEGP